ncbi:MAG: ABC transporter substrate binding protein [Mariprofundus sp.]
MIGLLSCALLSWSGLAEARSVFIINSINCCSYGSAMQGFEGALKGNVMRVCLAEEPDQQALLATLKQSHPDMVAAIGSSAARFATRYIKDVPVIYFMVMNPDAAMLRADNVRGVVLNQNPALMLDALQAMGAGAGHIGTLSAAQGEASFALQQLQTEVQARGLTLNVATVRGQIDDKQIIDKLINSSDAMILIPDRLAITARTYRHIVARCRQQRIPLLVPSGLLVKLGGLLSFTHDAADIGRQAAEMANRIMDGDAGNDRPEYARHNTMVINRTTSKWNRLRLPRSMQIGSVFYD